MILPLPLFIFAIFSLQISASPSPSPKPPPVLSYPRNLHRIYDGTWHSSSSPFQTPTPKNASIPAYPPPSTAPFQQTSGFALLTAENHLSHLGPTTNIVFGELLLRDGPYRTPRDLALSIMGIYEPNTGTIVLVGDVLLDDVPKALHRLYIAYDAARPHLTDRNITEERFIAALTSRFTAHQKQVRDQPRTQSRPIAEQCPFSATFAVVPGHFDDSLPPDSRFPLSFPSGVDPSISVTPPTVFSGRPASNLLPDQSESDLIHSSTQEEIVEMKGSFLSPPCHTDITLILSTLDTETLFGKAINYTLLVTVVAFAQVIVLIRQMEMTSTQAGARRISLLTVGLQAVADSYLCLGHLTMGIAVQTLFNAFATAAFFKFICFSIFLMRWMLLIWKARRPSGFSEGWEAMRRELSMLYSRFYGSLLFGIFLLYQMRNHLRFFVFALYSFWVPQIILNAMEDHRRPLLPVYIIGTSVTRLAIPLYFWGCPKNFLHIRPEPATAGALAAWLLSQAAILLSQHKFGPRWFIPKELLPEKYDYYRPITVEEDKEEPDIEAQSGSETHPLVPGPVVEQQRECCICMESVAVHSRERMVTPCNHFFHASCLERWLEVRLECALCRSPVPPP